MAFIFDSIIGLQTSSKASSYQTVGLFNPPAGSTLAALRHVISNFQGSGNLHLKLRHDNGVETFVTDIDGHPQICVEVYIGQVSTEITQSFDFIAVNCANADIAASTTLEVKLAGQYDGPFSIGQELWIGHDENGSFWTWQPCSGSISLGVNFHYEA